MPLYPRFTWVDSPMTQNAHETQRNARTNACKGWVSERGGLPSEGYKQAPHTQPGGLDMFCGLTNGLSGIIFVVAVIVAIMCLYHMNQTQEKFNRFFSQGAYFPPMVARQG